MFHRSFLFLTSLDFCGTSDNDQLSDRRPDCAWHTWILMEHGVFTNHLPGRLSDKDQKYWASQGMHIVGVLLQDAWSYHFFFPRWLVSWIDAVTLHRALLSVQLLQLCRRQGLHEPSNSVCVATWQISVHTNLLPRCHVMTHTQWNRGCMFRKVKWTSSDFFIGP